MPVDSGRYPSGQRGQTVNLLANAFGGSNPPLPTMDSFGGPARGVGGLSRARPGCVIQNRFNETCGNSSAVERQPSKLGVAGSNPVSRSTEIDAGGRGASRLRRGASERRGVGGPFRGPHENQAHVAQSAERVLGKDEVSGSIPDMGSRAFATSVSTVMNGR